MQIERDWNHIFLSCVSSFAATISQILSTRLYAGSRYNVKHLSKMDLELCDFFVRLKFEQFVCREQARCKFPVLFSEESISRTFVRTQKGEVILNSLGGQTRKGR